MKRLGSFLTALIMCAALAPPAFANGSNVENAEQGGKYNCYQILVPDAAAAMLCK